MTDEQFSELCRLLGDIDHNAHYASYIDDNTEDLNGKLDKIIELLQKLVKAKGGR